ncbi:MAG: transcription-repair coupling factor [Opitutaceae bacterium]
MKQPPILPDSPNLKTTRLIGVSPPARAAVIEDWISRSPSQPWFILGNDGHQIESLAEDLRLFHRAAGRTDASIDCRLLPELPEDATDGPGNFEPSGDRFATLRALLDFDPAKGGHLVVLTTPRALDQAVPEPEAVRSLKLEIRKGAPLPFREFIETLNRFDYDTESVCEAPGQMAVRGGIIDLYPVAADRPWRIDFFGDEVESVQAFDPVTQRSGEAVDFITVTPSPTMELPAAAEGIRGFLGSSMGWLLIDPEALAGTVSDHAREPGSTVWESWQRLIAARENHPDAWITISDLDLNGDDSDEDRSLTYEAESLEFYRTYPDTSRIADERLIDEQAARGRFLAQVAEWQDAGDRVVFVLPRQGEFDRVRELLEEEGLAGRIRPHFIEGQLNEGFRIRFRKGLGRLHWEGLERVPAAVIVTETELFGVKRKRRPRLRQRAQVNQSQVDQLLDFADLVEGEFVVHLLHGIAVYRGLKSIETGGQIREVLSLEFDAGVTLHVSLHESHLVSRYVGLSKIRPQLGRIGSGKWEKTRQTAERATLDYAAQLLEIQARRSLHPGFAFPEDTAWQKEFEATFPYRETPDQLKAIEEAKADMENQLPMDRLICGDVGFGKTEVALRAAFKAVMGGKQVALLVPTTVLAQQHFNTFRERMSGFPVVVEMVSRFRTRRDQIKILDSLAGGRVDILIGTHRLIQKDVVFRDLGLVIIDEEQRFGVRHKEVFKTWRANVEVLSMSATPIPRTLYQALVGARNLSVIETPPAERRPIITIVKSYEEKLVAEVIRKEIRRGGQVFYLHNRVQTIDEVASRLRQLVPEASFAVGHGQMDEKDLERIMVEFIDGRFQVLVCTTIIESGLDIPNCNTIIIEGADRFGLSQLYQLRGRVGRFKHQAYAYLLLHRHSRLLDLARKRLHALRQHNQLGAGFRIAMRDLELRGAGNLLGQQQSGYIMGVGFDLYCQLLRQSIARLKGEPIAATIRASVKLDFVYQGEGRSETSSRYSDGFTVLKQQEINDGSCAPTEARIPPAYITETRLRIDVYRRLAMAESVRQLREIGEELEDRFGKRPIELEALLALTEIRCLAEQKGIVSVETEGNRLKCRRASRNPDDFVMLGSRFPRLTASDPLVRLNEVKVFLRNLPPK